jgi:hypothetical protein
MLKSLLIDFILVLVSIVLGIYIERFWPKFENIFVNWKKNRRLSLLSESSAIHDWLIKYYLEQGSLNDLYDCKIGNYEVKIPFLTKPEWQYDYQIPFASNELIQYAETNPKEFFTDHKLINYRIKMGQVLFGRPSLYLDRIQVIGGAIQLHVKSCDYLSIATSYISLEEETFKAVKKRKYSNLKIRDEYIPNIEILQKLKRKPFAIGCAVALVLKMDGKYKVIINTRSKKTGTFGGSKAVIPNFGLEHIRKEINHGNQEGNILFYNFIKEYLEELYNYERLIDAMKSRKVNPYWFYDFPEAKELITAYENGMLTLEYLGFGFDALNGNAVISLLVVIKDENVINNIIRNIELNWEIQETEGELQLEFVDIGSEKLEQWLRENKYHSGAAFTISQTIERLEKSE